MLFRSKFAKEFGKTEESELFLKVLPHQYYEENNLHGLLIEQIRDYDKCLEELERFLPFIDNWATCDLLALHMMKKHRDIFIREVFRWIESDQPYTIRFGISMLMRHYLDEEFKTEYPEKVAAIRSEEYYVNMMRAWYFATALAKHRPSVCYQFSNLRIAAVIRPEIVPARIVSAKTCNLLGCAVGLCRRRFFLLILTTPFLLNCLYYNLT